MAAKRLTGAGNSDLHGLSEYLSSEPGGRTYVGNVQQVMEGADGVERICLGVDRGRGRT